MRKGENLFHRQICQKMWTVLDQNDEKEGYAQSNPHFSPDIKKIYTLSSWKGKFIQKIPQSGIQVHSHSPKCP